MAREYLDRYCIVDTETTGLVAGYNDIIEIAVIVLDEHMDKDPNIIPFHTMMLPSRPDNIDINALKVQQSNDDGKKLTRTKFDLVMRHGLQPDKCADLFIDWVDRIGLPPKGRLLPIAHNWVFDRGFIIDWLGQLSFDYAFSHIFMDTFPISKFIDATYVARGKNSPFGPSMRLKDIARDLGFVPDRSHNALDDCLTTHEVLKRLGPFII